VNNQAINPNDLVIWSDETLLVINKPSGMPTLQDGYNPRTVFLVGFLKSVFDPIWVVHRLDKETSGVIVFARTQLAHKVLNNQFEKRQASKIYHAIVIGNPTWINKLVDLPLRPNGDRRHRTVIDMEHGKPSITELRVIEQFENLTLIEAVPRTGRTHQIRAHLAAEGYPIIFDALYGNGQPIFDQFQQSLMFEEIRESPLLRRLGLHARSLTFLHPVSGQVLSYDAPYPQDLIDTFRYLHQYSIN